MTIDRTLLDLERMPTLDELKAFFNKHDWSAAKLSEPEKRTAEKTAAMNHIKGIMNKEFEKLARGKGMGAASKYFENEIKIQNNKRVWTRTNGVVNPGYLCYFTTQHGSVQTRINKGLSLEGACDTPMIPEWKLRMQANIIFREFLRDKEKVLAIANSMLEEHDITLEEENNAEEILTQKQSELDRLNKKRDTLMDMRVEGILSKKEFDERVKPIEKDIADLLAEINALLPQDEPENEIPNYEEKIKVLRYALEQYNNWDDKDVPDVVIEAYVEKIVASKDGFEWYLRFDGDTNDPLKCKVNGKRRETATYTVAGKNFPAASKGNSGSYKGKQIILTE